MIEQLIRVAGRDVSRETFARIERYVELLTLENQRQSLISPAGMADLWGRHILDGAQLLPLVERAGPWCDIGSGPGLPGLVIAILGGGPITLVEPRRLRAEFLRHVQAELGLEQVTVADCKVERIEGRFEVITARAVASLDQLFAMASHVAHPGTRWILPKGQSAKSELEAARRNWQGEFRLVPSQTQGEAAIIVADRVSRRGK